MEASVDFVWPDLRFDDGEPRYIAVGLIRDRVTVAVYAEIPGAIRVISMRKASRH